MRKKGSNTTKLCWDCEVINQNEIIFKGQFSTLKEISNELGLSYSQIVELSTGRKKDNKGRYDTNYRFTRINNPITYKLEKSAEEEMKEKYNKEAEEIIDSIPIIDLSNNDIGINSPITSCSGGAAKDDNPSMNGF